MKSKKLKSLSIFGSSNMSTISPNNNTSIENNLVSLQSKRSHSKNLNSSETSENQGFFANSLYEILTIF